MAPRTTNACSLAPQTTNCLFFGLIRHFMLLKWIEIKSRADSFSPKARKYPSPSALKFLPPRSLSKHVRRRHFGNSPTFSLFLLPLCFYSVRITEGSQSTCKETLTSRDQKDQTYVHAPNNINKEGFVFCSFLWLACPPPFFSLLYFVSLLLLFQQKWFLVSTTEKGQEPKFHRL